MIMKGEFFIKEETKILPYEFWGEDRAVDWCEIKDWVRIFVALSEMENFRF